MEKLKLRDEKTFCLWLLRGWMVYLRFNPGLWHWSYYYECSYLFILMEYMWKFHVCVCRNAIGESWKVYIFNTVRHITVLSVMISLFIIFQQCLRILVTPYSCQHLEWSKLSFFPWQRLLLHCSFNLYFLDYNDIVVFRCLLLPIQVSLWITCW